jgi:hypothetical protein
MDEILKAKIEEARERMNTKQAGINEDRKNRDRGIREWGRGNQRPANAERDQFRKSLTDAERSQIEQRIQRLLDENPTLSSVNAGTPESKTEPPSVSFEVLNEYFFLRDIVG